MKSALARCAPWSVMKMAGRPYRARASSTAATQKVLSSVFDTRPKPQHFQVHGIQPAHQGEISVGYRTRLIVHRECEDAVTGIYQEAERFDADVVVVGTKGGGRTKPMLGSVAAGVVASLRRPVLVVNPAKD